MGLRRDRSWIEEERDDREEDSPAFSPDSDTLTGVVLGELGWDWANFLWAWSRGLHERSNIRESCL